MFPYVTWLYVYLTRKSWLQHVAVLILNQDRKTTNKHLFRIVSKSYFPFSRPRRSRQSSLEKALPAISQSCDQLSSSSTSKTASPEKSLFSLPERLSESSDNLDYNEAERTSRRCRSCEGILDADEQSHAQLSLPILLDVSTQTKKKKNVMDRCVNKVRLCWCLVTRVRANRKQTLLVECVWSTTALIGLFTYKVNVNIKYKSVHSV